MTRPSLQKRDRCRHCRHDFPAWLPWAKAPNGVLLFGHLSQHHPDRMGPYRARLAAGEDITTVAAEAYDVVEEDST
jgi:hypothetical protein